MPVKTRSKKPTKRVDPNQLSLLDYVPAKKAAAPSAKSKVRVPQTKHAALGQAVPAIMSPKDAARYLNLSPETLKVWRKKRKGPPFTKVGARLIGYNPAELDAFLAANSRR